MILFCRRCGSKFACQTDKLNYCYQCLPLACSFIPRIIDEVDVTCPNCKLFYGGSKWSRSISVGNALASSDALPSYQINLGP